MNTSEIAPTHLPAPPRAVKATLETWTNRLAGYGSSLFPIVILGQIVAKDWRQGQSSGHWDALLSLVAPDTIIISVLALIWVATPVFLEVIIHRDARLLREGREATATILKARDRKHGRMRTIWYEFEAEGATWRSEAICDSRRSADLAPGAFLPILYQAGKPRRSKPLAAIWMVVLRSAVSLL